jgi:hypothetical protein
VPVVEVHMESPVAPERVRAALLDFTDNRPAVWPGIDPSLYAVYEVHDTWADIQEGSKMPGTKVWAKEHYDWSSPDVVTWTVTESNFCAPGSHVSATIKARDVGGSHIHLTWDRTPTSLIGRFATLMIVATRGKPISSSIRKGLDTLEKTTS